MASSGEGSPRKFFRPRAVESIEQMAKRVQHGLKSPSPTGHSVVYTRVSEQQGLTLTCVETDEGIIEVFSGDSTDTRSLIGIAPNFPLACEKFPELVTLYPADEIVSDVGTSELSFRLPAGEIFHMMPGASDWSIKFNDDVLQIADYFGGAVSLWQSEAEWGSVALSTSGTYLFTYASDSETELKTVIAPKTDVERHELAAQTFADCEYWPGGDHLYVESAWLKAEDLGAALGEYTEVSLNGDEVVTDGDWSVSPGETEP